MRYDPRAEPINRGIHAGRASPVPQVSGPREMCMADGCHSTTNGGKPYCLEHIDQMPYVVSMSDERHASLRRS